MWIQLLPEATWLHAKLRLGHTWPGSPHARPPLYASPLYPPVRAFLCPRSQAPSCGGPGPLRVWRRQEKSSGKEKRACRQRTAGPLPASQERAGRLPPGRAHTCRGNGTASHHRGAEPSVSES